MKKAIYLVLLFGVVTACKYFYEPKLSTETLLQSELNTFNWSDVDRYPSFSACDSIIEKPSKKACFETILTSHVLETLSKEHWETKDLLQDTISIEFKIDTKGAISLKKINCLESLKRFLPNLEQSIKNALQSLPLVSPAIKKNQEVSTQFTLPIIIQTNDSVE
jgi:hypothetical protein